MRDLVPGENIEQFYAKVNSTGLRLNRPELKKAEYLTTNFLRLIQQLTDLPELASLRLFTSLSSSRMNDLDFVSELVALLKFGISDKKDKVDELYQDDISDDEFDALYNRFYQTLLILNRLDRIRPIVRTRYKQKNDFYTIFHFFARLAGEDMEVLSYFYQVLVKLAPLIRPSQEECEPLRLYAFNCVTQSNSKGARQARNEMLEELLLNTRDIPTPAQEQVIKFLKMGEPKLRNVGRYFPLNCESIKYPTQGEFEL